MVANINFADSKASSNNAVSRQCLNPNVMSKELIRTWLGKSSHNWEDFPCMGKASHNWEDFPYMGSPVKLHEEMFVGMLQNANFEALLTVSCLRTVNPPEKNKRAGI